MATPYATAHLASTSSTQDEARSRYATTPLLVTTDEQRAGRGRHGRSWLAAPRAVAASLAVAPSWPESTWPRLTLVAGLAARDAVAGAVALDWPNDLVVADDKVGRLLADAADGVVVFGLGVNLWWPDPPQGMAAIWRDDPGPKAAQDIAAAFAEGLLARLESDPDDWGRTEYVALCATIGAPVEWEGGSGTAVDVATDGALAVDTGGSIVLLHSSEVERITRSTVPPMRPTT